MGIPMKGEIHFGSSTFRPSSINALMKDSYIQVELYPGTSERSSMPRLMGGRKHMNKQSSDAHKAAE
mgnify:CR=1 FL=1